MADPTTARRTTLERVSALLAVQIAGIASLLVACGEGPVPTRGSRGESGGGGGSGPAGAAGNVSAGGTMAGGAGGHQTPDGAVTGGAAGGDQDSGSPPPAPYVEYLEGVDVHTLAGAAEPGHTDGSLEDARFDNPVNVVATAAGDLYVSDFENGAVRVITASGQVETVFDDPRFERPFGMATGPSGELFVETDANTTGEVDMKTGSLWRIDPHAGTGEVLIENVGRPRGLAVRPDGRVVLADLGTHTLRIFDPETTQMAHFAGKYGEAGFVDGVGDEARFRRPYGAAWLPNGSLVVADFENHAIRVVSEGAEVGTLAGTGSAGMVDGGVAVAQFDGPKAVAVAADGSVYVSDTGNHRVRRISPDGYVRTVAGDGVAGYANGEGDVARFFGQEGLAVDSDGTSIVVADGNGGEPLPYNRVRVLTLTP